MKKHVVLFILFAFLALCVNVFGQTPTFNVKVSGSGTKSIIFIPGFASSGDVWNETVPQFEKKYTCYVLTMPGFAGVPADASPSFKKWETDIADFIKHKHITNPVIIGHSMGGGLALALAADYPDLISEIIIVDALPCLAALKNPSFKSKENPDCSASVSSMTAMSGKDFLAMQQGIIPRLMMDTIHLNEVVQWSVKSDRKTFGQMFCDFSNTDLREKISTIKCPSLILLESVFVSMNSAIKDQYKNLKNVQIVYSTKGLHFIMFDDKDWYLSQLHTFLNN